MYELVYRVLLRRLPAGTAHAAGFWLIRAVGAVPGGAWLLRRWLAPRDPALRVRALGLDLPGPLGLAAGFDKDARGADALGALGFEPARPVSDWSVRGWSAGPSSARCL